MERGDGGQQRWQWLKTLNGFDGDEDGSGRCQNLNFDDNICDANTLDLYLKR